MSRPLFLHIGLQKTGTSYLQSICWQSVDALREQGLDMVPDNKRDTFWLMLDARGRFQPEFDPPAVGRSVERLPEQLAAATGPRALVTEESFAPCSDEQIERLLAACGDREVHVVMTVRDLSRQIPSAWQQQLQAGSGERYAKYLDRLLENEGPPGGALWRNKDIPEILTRWSRHVPAERIHVVTVPKAGNDPELLLRRFCSVLGVDPAGLNRTVARKNESLKHVGAELLRRVNSRIDRDLRRRDVYGDVGKRYFAIQVLGPLDGRKILMPRELEEWCRSVSQRHVEFLRDGGFDVVGDLDDLVPEGSAFSDEGIRATESEVADAAADALAGMLTEQMKRRRKRAQSQRASRAKKTAPVRRRMRWARALVPSRR